MIFEKNKKHENDGGDITSINALCINGEGTTVIKIQFSETCTLVFTTTIIYKIELPHIN